MKITHFGQPVRQYRTGSNQYKKVKKHNAIKYLVYFGVFVILLIGIALSARKEAIEQTWASEEIISPVATYTPTPSKTPEQIATQTDIENYIKTIFGKEARVAIAVSHNECNPANSMYPKCQLHTDDENSIGLFQINIQSATTRVHWSRIPGETLIEKKKWLENPYNNTLLAYWIYQTSGWTPWSAYTSGRYLNDM